MSEQNEPKEPRPRSTRQRPQRALVIVPDLDRSEKHNPEDRLAEAVGLAEAISLDVTHALVVRLNALRPATFFGAGKVEEFAELLAGHPVDVVIVDTELSPVQQRNLEKALTAKVLDRTGLILEIFGERARTQEGRLQVELAHLNYQKSRLVRSWTHLERQRGGFGFLGGPGETQIEADRRMIEERVRRIEAELLRVATRRRLQRRNRQRNSQPTVALVGYTNAGKSTLFNALTKSGVFAHDQLFATLDPTLRRIELPDGRSVILSDTVGFVADLPTTLVAAFRATLEEVAEADLILHVHDAANSNAANQSEDVDHVLEELGLDPSDDGLIVHIWNKMDLPGAKMPDGDGLAVSALTGEGLDELLREVASRIGGRSSTWRVELTPERATELHKLYELGEVISRTDSDNGAVLVEIRVAADRLRALQRAFPEARDTGAGGDETGGAEPSAA